MQPDIDSQRPGYDVSSVVFLVAVVGPGILVD
jgi:hypothetical protein